MGLRKAVKLKALSSAVVHNQRRYVNLLYARYSEKVSSALDSISDIAIQQMWLLLNIERQLCKIGVRRADMGQFVENTLIGELKMRKYNVSNENNKKSTKNAVANLVLAFFEYNKEIARQVERAEKYTSKMFVEVEQNRIDSMDDVYKKYHSIKEKQKNMEAQVSSVRTLVDRIFPNSKLL